jgi:hypothetical protein
MTNQIMEGLQHEVATPCAGRDRQVGSPGHTAARTHLLARFREIGLAPYADSGFELAYEIRGTRFVKA